MTIHTQVLPANTKGISVGAGLLARGEVVAFPTETVYGLGANAFDSTAVLKIFEAKGRPADNPLIAHISDIGQLTLLALFVPPVAGPLIRAFWPGALTLIFKKRAEVPHVTTGGLDTVAVRMPAHPAAQALIREAGFPVAAPSANRSGRPSPTTAGHVYQDMQGRIPLILDGGASRQGLESTVLDLSGGAPRILRPGFVTLEQILQIAPDAVVDDAVLGAPDEHAAPKSPGMKYRHYAPKGKMTVYTGRDDDIHRLILDRCQKAAARGEKAGILAPLHQAKGYAGCAVWCLDDQNPENAESALYAALRDMDSRGIGRIYAHGVKPEGIGLALMNRLIRAAGHDVRQAASEPAHIVMLCTGNTCRSPMAQALMEDALLRRGIKGVKVSSAGTSATPGQPPSEGARRAMLRRGIDISGHRAAPISQEALKNADVYGMSPSHVHMAKAFAPKKARLLQEAAGLGSRAVADPFGGGDEEYERAAEEIAQAVEKIADAYARDED